jgi:uncharacterized protein
MERLMTQLEAQAPSPFHAGERAVQRRLGVEAIEQWARKAVRPYMPAQHRAFHTAQPFLIAAARDAMGRPWATVLEGPDGFVKSPDAKSLVIDARPPVGDALDGMMVPGADIGLLGIELATRRRNRMNGRIAPNDAGALVFQVDQSFGNCPQYITPRRWRRQENPTPGTPRLGTQLTTSQKGWIRSADTFFIASGHRGDGDAVSFGMDASHRGGEPGFLQVTSDNQLSFPDYAGNNHYNTIGNLVLDPRVGLLFVDFSSGSLLQISGQATIDWESDTVAREPGARRLVNIDIDAVIELPGALSLRWDEDAQAVRTLRVVEKIAESDDVTSFVFEARDGGILPDFEAGQHLPIEFAEPEMVEPVRRTYSLSGAPRDGRYRISVKREPQGLASNYLHKWIEPGAFINAGKPAGDFVVPDDTSPMVLISAGVGITPMVSALHALAEETPGRDVLFIHGARDGNHLPLVGEVRAVAGKAGNVRVHTRLSRPGPRDGLGINHESVGRIDAALLADLDIDRSAHYMICGPLGFMAELESVLQGLEVPGTHIHTETFGPAG